jgi:hypothetical protein
MLAACGSVRDLTPAMQVQPGDARARLISLMGQPQNRQFSGNREVLQYCTTGMMSDDYVAFLLVDNRVQTMTRYQNQLFGDCTSYFREVDWRRQADTTIEIRFR